MTREVTEREIVAAIKPGLPVHDVAPGVPGVAKVADHYTAKQATKPSFHPGKLAGKPLPDLKV